MFTVEAGGVELEFAYEDVCNCVKDAQARCAAKTWRELLFEVAKVMVGAFRDYIKGDVPAKQLIDVVFQQLLKLFVRFMDEVLLKVHSVVMDVVRLVKEFVGWLFGFFS